MPPERIILTGASGGLGFAVLMTALRRGASSVVCILRSESAWDRVCAGLPDHLRVRVTPLYADLRSDEQVEALRGRLPQPGARTLAVHCAAEVSWTKSWRLIAPLNVAGACRFAGLVIADSAAHPKFSFASTAYADDGETPRNAYEASKCEAERRLREGFVGLNLRIVRPSLIVGDQRTGHIFRHHGIYPLLRLIALAEVPCLIAEDDTLIDIVPVDAVADELLDIDDWRPATTIAAGDTALRVGDFVRLAQDLSNNWRRRRGLAPHLPISVINRRQYDFLMRAAGSWGMSEQFAKVQAIASIMDGYVRHGETGRPLRPSNMIRTPASPATLLPVVFEAWAEALGTRLADAPWPTWRSLGKRVEANW